MSVQSPIQWFGGKAKRAPRLLALFPPHHTYVEPFGGAASLLLAKSPSPVEIYNDINSGCVNFFRVLRDEEGYKKLRHKAVYTPYSREEFCYCRDTWQGCEDPVERAYRWYVMVRQSFAGQGKGWGATRIASAGGMSERTHAWVAATERLGTVHERLRCVQIEHNDFRAVLRAYDTPQTLFYCDPPYIPETRRSGTYAFEMSMEDHSDLVTVLLGLRGKVLLSGYQHPLYAPLEDAGWRRVDFQFACNLGAHTSNVGAPGKRYVPQLRRTESVWISPNADIGWQPSVPAKEEEP